MVDVAGGHGGFAMAMCRRHPGSTRPCSTCRRARASDARSSRSRASPTGCSFREGDVFELGLGEEPRRGLGLQPDPSPAGGARPRAMPDGPRGAAARRRLVIGDSARPEPGEPVSEHGAISSLLFYAWSHSRNFTPSEIRGWMEDAGFSDVRGAPQRALALARGGGRGGDPAHRRHGHGGLGAAAPPDRRGRAGALPGARPAPARRPARARADRARATSPTRPRFATPCAASTPSCTWRPRSATSRAPRSRS